MTAFLNRHKHAEFALGALHKDGLVVSLPVQFYLMATHLDVRPQNLAEHPGVDRAKQQRIPDGPGRYYALADLGRFCREL